MNEAIADLVNAHARLDIWQAWGDGSAVAADGTHMDTYLSNLLTETSVRYGKPGGISHHHISDPYIALFTHFIPCGVWEAVYVIEGLLKKGLTFYRLTKRTQYAHIDALFGEPGRNVIDFDLIESQFRHLMRVAVSVREGAISSPLLLRRLRAGSRKNATYIAFREVGRVIRAVQLLRYLSDAPLRRRVTAATNKVEAPSASARLPEHRRTHSTVAVPASMPPTSRRTRAKASCSRSRAACTLWTRSPRTSRRLRRLPGSRCQPHDRLRQGRGDRLEPARARREPAAGQAGRPLRGLRPAASANAVLSPERPSRSALHFGPCLMHELEAVAVEVGDVGGVVAGGEVGPVRRCALVDSARRDSGGVIGV
ncbi:Tn3 family transposase [Streptomyces sp. NPDC127079]|uniref:Tn3 family transposase n=1 Tax=Streptomyces sp. NPDC127079 TaxID=3347132 RepID=UPI00364D1457